MAEQAEIPEVDSPFGKRVAVTIAIVAVVMAIISNRGDDAKTDALLKTTESANIWSHYQSKSIKEHAFDIQAQVMSIETSTVEATARTALIKKFESEAQRYKKEKNDLQIEAQNTAYEAQEAIAVNNRCDQATLFMQLAVVACSVAILAHLAIFWWGGIIVAVVGIVLGVSSFWVKPEGAPADRASSHSELPKASTPH